jgi:hypothetical protein
VAATIIAGPKLVNDFTCTSFVSTDLASRTSFYLPREDISTARQGNGSNVIIPTKRTPEGAPLLDNACQNWATKHP